MKQMPHKSFRLLDSHTLQTFIQRSWSVLGGAALIFALPYFLDPVSQGYYFSFAGIISLQYVFEFGMNQAITQIAAHAYSDQKVNILATIRKVTVAWYLISAILFALFSIPFGLHYFQSGNLTSDIWGPTWVILVIATACNLYLSPSLAILEGLGQIGEVAKLRTFQSALGYALTIFLFFLGFGLLAIVAIPTTSAFITLVWTSRSTLLHTITNTQIDPTFTWKQHILPLQWRIGFSWISGYVVQQSMTPIIFKNQGAIAAGQFGLTLALFNAVSLIGLSWASARAPVFANLIAKGSRDELKLTLNAVLINAFLTTAIGAALVLAIVVYVDVLMPSRQAQISGIPVALFLALACVSNAITFTLAIFLRAHKKEPILHITIISGCLQLFCSLLLSRYSVEAVAASYGLITLLVTLPLTIRTSLSFYRNA